MSIPRPEYPRPQFARPDWLCLNGEWQFEIDSGDDAMTLGRPHPMIDPTLRLQRLATDAADPTFRGRGTSSTSASRAICSVAVLNRCSGSRAQLLANHSSNAGPSFGVFELGGGYLGAATSTSHCVTSTAFQ